MLFLILAAAISVPVRMPPVDQCPEGQGFGKFRAELAQVIEKRDMAALLALTADDVRVSFGGQFGKGDFLRYWEQQAGGQAQLWAELSEAVRLGCGAKGNARVFPSMFAQSEGLDGFETWIAKPGARLRKVPSVKGTIVTRLSWHVLALDGTWTGNGWIPVKLADGRRGYVSESAVRSPIDYRLIVNHRDGRWQITAFIAGD